ncbi:MAG: glycoside hydrolase family 3 C-terminal domain-containing protein [Lachnospiraceae bacterium]
MEKMYQDVNRTPQERAAALLAELNLDEKMAQVNCIFPFGESYNDMEKIAADTPFGIGEVSTLEMRRIGTLEEAARWQRDVQRIVMENSPHHIPAVFHMEGLCGAFIQDTASFPAGIGRGAGFDTGLEERIAETVSRQEAACGITHILAPVLDISRDSRMGRQGETYGEDPALASALGAAYTRGIQKGETAGRRTESVAKHFLAFHNSQGGIHGTHSDTPARLLREIYGKPFQAAIAESGLKGIMPSYNSINGEPVSASRTLLNGLLREEMGFDGLCVSDYGAVGNVHQVQHVGEDAVEAGLLCMQAGMVSLQSARESLVLLKNNGALPLKEADRRKKIALIGPHADCARKFFGGYTHLCMMESTYAVANSIAGVSGVVQADAATIRTVPGTNIQSDETEVFNAILRRQKPACRSLLEEMRARLPEAEICYAYGYPVAGADESRFAEALQAVNEADLVILTLGGKHGTCSMASMGEGVDASNINLPPCQEAFIRKAAESGKPLIGVHFDGRPISSDAADAYLDAILEAWSPAECGAEAVVDALIGAYNPGGKLPVSVAYHAGQIPIYYNHPYGSAWHQGESIGFVNYVDLPHTPRYYFGHGLSYTTFSYSDLWISEREIDARGSVRIGAAVSNTGGCEGEEVVQLYLTDRYASMTRPVKELAGFTRISLKPGEKKRVVFEVQASLTAFLDRDMRWKIEKGEIGVEIGSSSEDIRLTGAYSVKNDAWIEGRDRTFYAILQEVRRETDGQQDCGEKDCGGSDCIIKE